VEVFTGGLFSVTPALNTIIAGRYPSVLNFYVCRRVGELALRVGPSALLTLKFTTHLQLQPSAVLLVEQIVDVEHGECVGGKVGGVRHRRCGGHVYGEMRSRGWEGLREER